MISKHRTAEHNYPLRTSMLCDGWGIFNQGRSGTAVRTGKVQPLTVDEIEHQHGQHQLWLLDTIARFFVLEDAHQSIAWNTPSLGRTRLKRLLTVRTDWSRK